MSIMIKSNKYVLYYLEMTNNVDKKNRYYKYCKYKENDKITIQNINKEINRQMKLYDNGDIVNRNYVELMDIFSDESYTISIYGGSNDKKVEEEYQKLIKLPQYRLRPKPKLKREMYDNSYSEEMIQNDFNERLISNEKHNRKIENKKTILKNKLIERYSINKFIEGDINTIKKYFNDFIDKNETLNEIKENIKNNPNEKILCSCGVYYTRTNRSHHYKKYHTIKLNNNI